METVITILIVAAAGFWFVRWFRGTANGEKGCACGSCGKNCPSRQREPDAKA